MYRIVFLTDKKHYDSKMSRVRFHSIRALFSREDVQGFYTGPNWDNWIDSFSAQENLDTILGKEGCDLVISYKPLDKGIVKYDQISYRKCIRYNEMYDKEWTLKEISMSGSDVVVCHHYNDYVEYKKMNLNNIDFKWVPHSSENSIYKPMPEIEKRYDIALLGALSCQTLLGEHYPLRVRMANLLRKMPAKYNCVIFPHVGYDHNDAHTDRYAKDFAEKINSCKIVITDSGAPNSRFGKYIEIPMCGTAIAGDLYDDHPNDVENLKKFLIEINMDMSDEEILNKLIYYIENSGERFLKVKEGLDYCKEFTQEKYAEKFVQEVLS